MRTRGSPRGSSSPPTSSTRATSTTSRTCTRDADSRRFEHSPNLHFRSCGLKVYAEHSVLKLAYEQSEIRVFESHCLSDVQDEDETSSSSSSSEEDGDGEVKIGGKRAAASSSKKGKRAKRRPRAPLEREIETEDGSTQRERITS